MARSVRAASDPSSRRPSTARRKLPGWKSAQNFAGVMLWYWRTRPRGSVANASVIGDGSAKWRMVTSPVRAAGSANASASSRMSSSTVSAKICDAWPCRRRMSRTRLALSPIASPRCAAGTHWLMTMACRYQDIPLARAAAGNAL